MTLAINVIFEGSSGTAGSGVTDPAGISFADMYEANARPNTTFYNPTAGGEEIDDFENRLAANIGHYAAGAMNIVTFQPFSNNVSVVTVGLDASLMARTAAVARAYRDAGAYVFVATMMPHGNTTYNANRNLINAVLPSWVGVYCDELIDVASDPTIGTDAAGFDVAIVPDGGHQSLYAYEIMERLYYRPKLNGVRSLKFRASW